MNFQYPSVLLTDMLPERVKILMMGLMDAAAATMEINITKNMVLGEPMEAVNGKYINVLENCHLPNPCMLTQFVSYFRKFLPEEEVMAYDEFYNHERLINAYEDGKIIQTHSYWINFTSDSSMYINLHIILYKDPISKDILGICFSKDITELRLENQKGSRALLDSHIDHLTQVYNRRKLESFAKNYLETYNTQGAFILVDVDNFKALNDAMGHGFGDTVLVEIAALLKNVSLADDLVARLGGDEFVVFVPNIYNKRNLDHKLALTISQAFKTVTTNDGKILNISLSVGVSLFPQNATTYEELYAKADKAMYMAKSLGRNRYVMYDEIADSLVENILTKPQDKPQQVAATLRDADCRSILDSFQSTAVYIISEEGHRLLYVNKLISDRVPDLRLGSVCHEVWAGYCANCPIKILGDAPSARTISHYNPFGKPMEISATRMMWRNAIPAIIIRVYPHYEKEDF